MYRVKVDFDGFDGTDPFKPGDTVNVDLGQAKRLVLRHGGTLLDDKGKPMTAAAVKATLRPTEDDMRRFSVKDNI